VLGGSPSPQVWIYWGTSDGTTNKGSWNLGALPMGTPGLVGFSTNVTGLPANQTYWYRCAASNINGEGWAASSAIFTTLPPSIVINDIGLLEGAQGTTNTAVFTVTLSATSAVPVTVDYTNANGTATAGSDYVGTSGTLSIPADTWSGTISVSVIGDNTVESDEIFYVNLTNAVHATIARSQGQCTISNDDFAVYVRGDGLGSDTTHSGTTWETPTPRSRRGWTRCQSTPPLSSMSRRPPAASPMPRARGHGATTMVTL